MDRHHSAGHKVKKEKKKKRLKEKGRGGSDVQVLFRALNRKGKGGQFETLETTTTNKSKGNY